MFESTPMGRISRISLQRLDERHFTSNCKHGFITCPQPERDWKPPNIKTIHFNDIDKVESQRVQFNSHAYSPASALTPRLHTDPYLHRPTIWRLNAKQSVSVGGHRSSGLQRFGLDGAAVHVERGGAVLHAQGDLVPPQVHQRLHPLARENAARQIGGGVLASGAQGQAAIGTAEVHRDLHILVGGVADWGQGGVEDEVIEVYGSVLIKLQCVHGDAEEKMSNSSMCAYLTKL